MSLKKSKERLENSNIEPTKFAFKLKDIAEIFHVYEKFDEKSRKEGKLTAVMGRDKDGLKNMHLVLFDAEGRKLATANDSHPCPPFTDCC